MADLVRRYGRIVTARQCRGRRCGRSPGWIVVHAVGPVWRGGGAGKRSCWPARVARRWTSPLARAPALSPSRRSRPGSMAIRSTSLPASRSRPPLPGSRAPGALDRIAFVLFSDASLQAFERAQRAESQVTAAGAAVLSRRTLNPDPARAAAAAGAGPATGIEVIELLVGMQARSRPTPTSDCGRGSKASTRSS